MAEPLQEFTAERWSHQAGPSSPGRANGSAFPRRPRAPRPAFRLSHAKRMGAPESAERLDEDDPLLHEVAEFLAG